MSDIGQDLINSPKDDLRRTKAAKKQAEKQRSQSQTALNLAAALSNKTYAGQALAQINANQAAWAEQLTPAHLKQFSNAVTELQKDFQGKGISGGITPKDIISRSRRIDITRAEQEIHTVQAVKFDKNGVIEFRTNASKKYGATHHTVTVQFLNFQAALIAGNLTQKFLDDYMKSAVKFDCDCGRHTYWYRYIASVGSFAYGRIETAFPKIRNRELTGLACKHVIRVMHTLNNRPATLRGAIKKHIERYRLDPNKAAQTLSKKQADKVKIVANVGQQIRRGAIDKMLKETHIAAKKKTNISDKNKAKLQLKSLLNMGLLSGTEYNEKLKIIDDL